MKKGPPGTRAGAARQPEQADLFGAPVPAEAPPKPEPAPAALAPLAPALPVAPVAPVVVPEAPAAPAPSAVPPPAPARPAPAPEPYPWRVRQVEPTDPEARARRQVLTVGELTRQIKGTLERGFGRVTVRGEVTGFRGPNARGHLYFSLKDEEACLDARIWASAAQRMKFKLRDGLSVVAEGSIDVYEPQGRYSLIIQRIEPAGEGALALAFQQLKEKLQEEGLFGDKRVRPQRPIPMLPRRIGVVTSVTGAALYDFLRVLHARHPRLSVLVCDSRVQGEGAALEVVVAIERLSRTDVDVIVVTRGGGSIEDLWTFNEEAVARAIFACKKPVISAIGHEVDFTIADFVADYRAPTPSAAAEKLAPVLRDLELGLANTRARLHKTVERNLLTQRQSLHRLKARLVDPRRLLAQRRLHVSAQADLIERAMRAKLRAAREQLRAQQERLARQRPQAQLQHKRELLSRLKARLLAAGREHLRRQRQALAQQRIAFERASPRRELQRLRALLARQRGQLLDAQRRRLAGLQLAFHQRVAKLNAMSPLEVMARGYSVTFRKSDGHIVRKASDVQVGDALAIRLAGGDCRTLDECEEVDATVTAVKGVSR